jgi:phosphoribosylformylglycinamidine (FGAM) synthase-like enzyme
VSDGGLFITLLECAMEKGIGFTINAEGNFRKDAFLFGESQSRIAVTVREADVPALGSEMNMRGIPFTRLGKTGGDEVVIDNKKYGKVSAFRQLYDTAIESILESGINAKA